MIDHDEIQADLSARLDGEEGRLADDVVSTHLAACPECRAFLAQSSRLRDMLHSPPSPEEDGPGVDLAEAIVAEVEPEWRLRSGQTLVWDRLSRVGVIVVAFGWVWWAITALKGTSGLEPEPGSGVGQIAAGPELAAILVQLGAVRLAVAGGLFLSGLIPRMLSGLLPFLGAWLMFTAGFIARDVLLGSASAEAVAGLLWLLVTVFVVGWAWAATGGVVRVRRRLHGDPA